MQIDANIWVHVLHALAWFSMRWDVYVWNDNRYHQMIVKWREYSVWCLKKEETKGLASY